jgi:hypothetical protein
MQGMQVWVWGSWRWLCWRCLLHLSLAGVTLGVLWVVQGALRFSVITALGPSVGMRDCCCWVHLSAFSIEPSVELQPGGFPSVLIRPRCLCLTSWVQGWHEAAQVLLVPCARWLNPCVCNVWWPLQVRVASGHALQLRSCKGVQQGAQRPHLRCAFCVDVRFAAFWTCLRVCVDAGALPSIGSVGDSHCLFLWIGVRSAPTLRVVPSWQRALSL